MPLAFCELPAAAEVDTCDVVFPRWGTDVLFPEITPPVDCEPVAWLDRETWLVALIPEDWAEEIGKLELTFVTGKDAERLVEPLLTP